jgi:hypothetical protein
MTVRDPYARTPGDARARAISDLRSPISDLQSPVRTISTELQLVPPDLPVPTSLNKPHRCALRSALAEKIRSGRRPISHRALCAIARTVIVKTPTIADSEWYEQVKWLIAHQGWFYPQPHEILSAIRRVAHVVGRRC